MTFKAWLKDTVIGWLIAIPLLAVALVAVGAFMLYGLPLLATWYGWVGATVLTAIIVVAFDMDY